MTEAEKVALVSTLVNDNSIDESVIQVYLTFAKDRILGKMYPFVDYMKTKTETKTVTEVDDEGNEVQKEVEVEIPVYPLPLKYERVQCELASRMILRRGTEGERGHNENGVNRTYDSVDDSDILSRVSQVLRVV